MVVVAVNGLKSSLPPLALCPLVGTVSPLSPNHEGEGKDSCSMQISSPRPPRTLPSAIYDLPNPLYPIPPQPSNSRPFECRPLVGIRLKPARSHLGVLTPLPSPTPPHPLLYFSRRGQTGGEHGLAWVPPTPSPSPTWRQNSGVQLRNPS